MASIQNGSDTFQKIIMWSRKIQIISKKDGVIVNLLHYFSDASKNYAEIPLIPYSLSFFAYSYLIGPIEDHFSQERATGLWSMYLIPPSENLIFHKGNEGAYQAHSSEKSTWFNEHWFHWTKL